MVWSRCRTDVFAHQQWDQTRVSTDKAERDGRRLSTEGFLLQLGTPATSQPAEPLCVAAPVPLALLASTR